MRTHIKHFINWQAQGCVAKGFRVRHTAHIDDKGVIRQVTNPSCAIGPEPLDQFYLE
jgi:hypothetical protein